MSGKLGAHSCSRPMRNMISSVYSSGPLYCCWDVRAPDELCSTSPTVLRQTGQEECDSSHLQSTFTLKHQTRHCCMQRQGVAAFWCRRSWACNGSASQIGNGAHEAMQGSQKVCPHGSARGFFLPSAPGATRSGVVPVPEAIPASFSLQQRISGLSRPSQT